MKNIYDKHEKAFNKVRAGVLTVEGKVAGTLAFKYPTNGVGRVTCYLHIHGHEMVNGSAGGYGYNKSNASFEAACLALCEGVLTEYPLLKEIDCEGSGFIDALEKIGIKYLRAL